MFKWVFRTADSQFLFGGPMEPVLSAGQDVITLPRNPNPRIERYQAGVGIRQATAEEIAAYDAETKETEATLRFDEERLLKALAIWCAQKFGVPLATARTELLTIYKGLA